MDYDPTIAEAVGEDAHPKRKTSIAKIKRRGHGDLPATYEAAKSTLAQCVEVDECKDWSNKALAMAVYARQMNDDALLTMARRIQARAVRRCGELLKEIRPATGAHLKRSVDVPLSRKAAAVAAGLSPRQLKAAIRLSSIPSDRFERLVESSTPSTIAGLEREYTKDRKRSEPPEPVPEFHVPVAVGDLKESVRKFVRDWPADGLRCIPTALRDLAAEFEHAG